VKELSPTSKAFITLIVAPGAAVLVDALLHWNTEKLTAFLLLLALSVIASRLRVKLPAVTGVMSMNLPFILVAVAGDGANRDQACLADGKCRYGFLVSRRG
jgi:hypothetical protein